MSELHDGAVALGASTGGLLATRVLADFYRTVIVVERIVVPRDPVSAAESRNADILMV
jgi:hypothetical protein